MSFLDTVEGFNSLSIGEWRERFTGTSQGFSDILAETKQIMTATDENKKKLLCYAIEVREVAIRGDLGRGLSLPQQALLMSIGAALVNQWASEACLEAVDEE